jgi:hypothetical protein
MPRSEFDSVMKKVLSAPPIEKKKERREKL